MMDCTDRHFRYFLRRLTRRTLLYTEMITSWAVLQGNRQRLLGYHPDEKPLVLQLGGEDPGQLAECARIAEAMGYNGLNLNAGCPSERVVGGRFGACLMAEPDRVARIVEAMRRAVAIPVSVKHRIGIDDLDCYEDMARFVAVVAGAGCDRFIVHARKAWLNGLDPKANRTIPPLRYADVYRLKAEFPHLTIEINGGIRSLEAATSHLAAVDGVMIGRAAYEDPYLFATADQQFYGETEPPLTRRQAAEAMFPYIEEWAAQGLNLLNISRHMLHLFKGLPGSRYWKRYLSEQAFRPGAGPAVFQQALQHLT